MIVVNDKPGQLCNRLWAYSFFIAYALKQCTTIYIPHLREYGKYFENVYSIPHVHFAVVKKPPGVDTLTFHCYRLITKVLRIIITWFKLRIPRIYLDPYNWTRESWRPSVLNKKGNIVFLGSWFHPKDVSALLEFKDVIVKLFDPRTIYKNRVDILFRDLRNCQDLIIGIHIRRGDYARFYGGIYLFDDNIYKNYMKAVQDAFRDTRVCFFLSSDEMIVNSHFDGYKIAYLERPVMVEDMYALSQCDYILGPPSTFSMWASFIGDVPLRIVKYKDEEIALDQFSPILYQNVFKNGERFHHVGEDEFNARHKILSLSE
jgi:Glycosyl transferase family 11